MNRKYPFGLVDLHVDDSLHRSEMQNLSMQPVGLIPAHINATSIPAHRLVVIVFIMIIGNIHVFTNKPRIPFTERNQDLHKVLNLYTVANL